MPRAWRIKARVAAGWTLRSAGRLKRASWQWKQINALSPLNPLNTLEGFVNQSSHSSAGQLWEEVILNKWSVIHKLWLMRLNVLQAGMIEEMRRYGKFCIFLKTTPGEYKKTMLVVSKRPLVQRTPYLWWPQALIMYEDQRLSTLIHSRLHCQIGGALPNLTHDSLRTLMRTYWHSQGHGHWGVYIVFTPCYIIPTAEVSALTEMTWHPVLPSASKRTTAAFRSTKTFIFILLQSF